jgi:hypothetical protein
VLIHVGPAEAEAVQDGLQAHRLPFGKEMRHVDPVLDCVELPQLA